MLCGVGENEAGSCEGDSGGPIVVDNILVGIVSFGLNICGHEYPSVFTKVQAFLNFITKHTHMKGSSFDSKTTKTETTSIEHLRFITNPVLTLSSKTNRTLTSTTIKRTTTTEDTTIITVTFTSTRSSANSFYDSLPLFILNILIVHYK